MHFLPPRMVPPPGRHRTRHDRKAGLNQSSPLHPASVRPFHHFFIIRKTRRTPFLYPSPLPFFARKARCSRWWTYVSLMVGPPHQADRLHCSFRLKRTSCMFLPSQPRLSPSDSFAGRDLLENRPAQISLFSVPPHLRTLNFSMRG